MRHGFGSLIFIPKGEGRHSYTLTVSPFPPLSRVPSNYYDSSFQFHRDVLGASFIHHLSKRFGLIHMSFCSLVQALISQAIFQLCYWPNPPLTRPREMISKSFYMSEKAIGRIRLYAIKERSAGVKAKRQKLNNYAEMKSGKYVNFFSKFKIRCGHAEAWLMMILNEIPEQEMGKFNVLPRFRWKVRTIFLLNKFLQDWDVFPKAEKYTQEFMEVQRKDQNPRSSDDMRQNKWKRPPIGVFKLNIDAGVNIRGG
ncbi:unnamed protein product [Linum trigynum]|uniref:Uncharacterized protein n=1 Tax=Linum trigynum TaxID=586398 RepID=A0AAV2EY64_9ROSI